jgi:hypothetical protein
MLTGAVPTTGIATNADWYTSNIKTDIFRVTVGE